MQQAISCLSQKEKDLAKQYFSFVDVDNSGWLDKRELKVPLLPLCPQRPLFCFVCSLAPSIIALNCTAPTQSFRTTS
jgi:hypothetical protein